MKNEDYRSRVINSVDCFFCVRFFVGLVCGGRGAVDCSYFVSCYQANGDLEKAFLVGGDRYWRTHAQRSVTFL